MMQSNHTKGPWIWQSFDGGKTYFLGTPDRGRLVVMDFVSRRAGGSVQQAVPRFALRSSDDIGGILMKFSLDEVLQHPDARLIAAAPDFLDALIAIKSLALSGATHIHAICDDAIAKATGGAA